MQYSGSLSRNTQCSRVGKGPQSEIEEAQTETRCNADIEYCKKKWGAAVCNSTTTKHQSVLAAWKCSWLDTVPTSRLSFEYCPSLMKVRILQGGEEVIGHS